MPVISERDEWRAQEDAYTLAEAKKIQKDQVRLTRAQQAAKKLADERAEDAQSMRQVAGRKENNSTPAKGNAKMVRDSKPQAQTGRPRQGQGASQFNVFKKIG
ncbi:MAG: hypothetical protein PVG39_00105 [Desulfobacteraceae bacterium]|jgi:hypothetical protein